MNSACLIAACAASKRNQNPDRYVTYTNFRNEFYYTVKFRMYIHFNRIAIVYPCEKGYLGSVWAPYESTFMKPVYVDGKTLAKERQFTVNSKNCKPTVDEYIKNNISKFTESCLWTFDKSEIIGMYLEDIKRKYNVIIDESSLDYSIQFIWEVDSI